MAIMGMSENPQKKGGGEKVLEWLPITGTAIAGKDTYLYFKDGKYMAGGIMAAATAVSLAGDVLMFTGVGKIAGTAGRKALAEGAAKVAEKTAEKAGTKAAEKVAEEGVKVAAAETGKEAAKSKTVGLVKGVVEEAKATKAEVAEGMASQLEKIGADRLTSGKLTKKVYAEATELAADAGKMKKAIVWAGYSPAFVATVPIDAGVALVKGVKGVGGWTIRNTAFAIMEHPIPAVSGVIARKGGSSLAEGQGRSVDKERYLESKKAKEQPKVADAQKPAVSTGASTTVEAAKLTFDEQKYKSFNDQVFSNIDKLSYSNITEYKAFLADEIKGAPTEKGKFEKLTATLNAHVTQGLLTKKDKETVLDVK